MTRRREALVYHRLEQHRAPAVVRRIIEQPDLVKLSGERREVTSPFTDIESFTATMHRAGPEELVTTLDDYFEGVADIVIKHGGMIDKIVGDGVHALFSYHSTWRITHDAPSNARSPFKTGARAFAAAPPPRNRARPHANRDRDGGRYRRRRRHSIQARLHGSRRCREYGGAAPSLQQGARVGDLCRALCRCGAPLLRPLGRLAIRGREEPIAVFEPWPSDTPSAWREAYLKAYAMLDCDAANAALLLQKLMAERPADSAVRRLAEPLTSIGKIGSSVPIADDQRTTPELTGEVIRVSPDVNTDQRSGQSTTPFVSRCRRTNWRPRGA